MDKPTGNFIPVINLLQFNINTILSYGSILFYFFISIFNVFNIFGDEYGSWNFIAGTITSGYINIDYPVQIGVITSTLCRCKVNILIQWRNDFKITIIVEYIDAKIEFPDVFLENVKIFLTNNDIKNTNHNQFHLSYFEKLYLPQQIVININELNIQMNEEMHLSIPKSSIVVQLPNVKKNVISYSYHINFLEIKCLTTISADKLPSLLALNDFRLSGDSSLTIDSSSKLDLELEDCTVAINSEYQSIIVSFLTQLMFMITYHSYETTTANKFKKLLKQLKMIDKLVKMQSKYESSFDKFDNDSYYNTYEGDLDTSCSRDLSGKYSDMQQSYKITSLNLIVIDNIDANTAQIFKFSELLLMNITTNPNKRLLGNTDTDLDNQIISKVNFSIHSISSCMVEDCKLLATQSFDTFIFESIHSKAVKDEHCVDIQYSITKQMLLTTNVIVFTKNLIITVLPIQLPLNLSTICITSSFVKEVSLVLNQWNVLKRMKDVEQLLFSTVKGALTSDTQLSQQSYCLPRGDLSINISRIAVEVIFTHQAQLQYENVRGIVMSLENLEAKYEQFTKSSSMQCYKWKRFQVELLKYNSNAMITVMSINDIEMITKYDTIVHESETCLAFYSRFIHDAIDNDNNLDWKALDLCAEQKLNQINGFSLNTSLKISNCSIDLDQYELFGLSLSINACIASSKLYNPLYYFHRNPVEIINTNIALKKSKLSILVNELNVKLNRKEENQCISYVFCEKNKIRFNNTSLDDIYTKNELKLYGDLHIQRILSDNNCIINKIDLIILTNIDPSNKNTMNEDFNHTTSSIKLFTSKSMASNVHIASGLRGYPIGFKTTSTYTNYKLEHLLITFDCKYIEQLCLIVHSYQIAMKLGESIAINNNLMKSISNNSQTNSISEKLFKNNNLIQVHCPTKITSFSLNSIKLHTLHLLEPLFCLSMKDIQVHNLQFGPLLNQSNFLLHSILLLELSAKYAVHTCIIGNINEKLTNRLELHCTRYGEECSLLEFHTESMRIMYLHRAIFTIWIYLSDHLTPSLSSYLHPASEILFKNVLEKCATIQYIPHYNPINTGMMRTSGLFTCCEFHLPLNSCSTDAIVIILNELRLYRSCPLLYDQSAIYCQGPYLYHEVWVGQLKSSRILMNQLFRTQSDKDQLLSLNVNWNLSELIKPHLVPPSSVTLNGSSLFGLNINILNSILCSWCNVNSISQDFNARVIYTLVQIPSENLTDPVRNTIKVDVSTDQIEWVLSQGQYSAIIALIQQNFCELQELVKSTYVLPPAKLVSLSEHVYGTYSLEKDIPILSTVPIHFEKGKIVLVENDSDYYKFFCHSLPPPHHPYGVGLAGYQLNDIVFEDTIPKYSRHIQHRMELFSYVTSEKKRLGKHIHNEVIMKDIIFNEYSTFVEENVETVLAVLFQKLEIDFYRKHENGGNGIEVSSQTFVICSADTTSTNNYYDMKDDDDAFSMNSLDLDIISLDSIIFAPKSYSLFNTATINHNKRKQSTSDTMLPNDETLPIEPHIKYSQQGNGNLRRCIITISDSVAVANIAKVLHSVEYFLKPIHLNAFRNVKYIEKNGIFDYNVSLDCEVHVQNTIVCFTNISVKDGENALCLHLNLDYAQAWRGFVTAGPGKISLNIDISIMNIYISPMREISSNRMKSIVDPFMVVVDEKTIFIPESIKRENNLHLLSKLMTFGDWVYRENSLPSPNSNRTLTFKVSPLLGKQPNNTTIFNNDVTIHNNNNEEEILNDQDIEDQINKENDEDLFDDDNNDYDYDFINSKNSNTIRSLLSLKDIIFVVEAVDQIRADLQKRLMIAANKKDYSINIKKMKHDVLHLPPLTYYLVHTSFPIQIINTAVNSELISEICDFEVLLRNNTYNLDIIKWNSYNNCMMYRRSTDQLQLESGSSCAIWAYNESIEQWEPLIEPIILRAIAAKTNDSLIPFNKTTNEIDLSANFRIEVISDPLEINISQNTLVNLMNKLVLPDVITTSSMLLPPYKVINEIGTDIKFYIRMSGSNIQSKTLSTGKVLPIEVYQLSEALDAYKQNKKLTRNRKYIHKNVFTENEYRLDVLFTNYEHTFRSKYTVPIDRVGIHRFEMIPVTMSSSSVTSSHKMLNDTGISVLNVNNPELSIEETLNVEQTKQQIDNLVTENTDNSSIMSKVNNITITNILLQKKKAVIDAPLAILDMKIKDDGVRELLLRSILSIKNNTNQVFQISIRFEGEFIECSMLPDREWYVPVRFCHPKASLYCRTDDRMDWFEMLSSFQVLIIQGYWGTPTKLQAHLSTIPQDKNSIVGKGSTSNGGILLIKPECKDARYQSSHSSASNSGIITEGTSVPVRYPSHDMSVVNNTSSSSHESGILGQAGKIRNIGGKAQPMCIHLLPPLQLCNFITQPLLYRIADSEGIIMSEGILLPGELVDIYSLSKLFSSKIFISVRMLNYCWSKWSICFTRNNPYTTVERSLDLSLQSMTFNYNDKLLTLPQLDIVMVVKEYLIRFVCPMIISNRTGMQLDIALSTSTDCFIPNNSKTSVEAILPVYNHQRNMTGLNTKDIDTPVLNNKNRFSVRRQSYKSRRTSSILIQQKDILSVSSIADSDIFDKDSEDEDTESNIESEDNEMHPGNSNHLLQHIQQESNKISTFSSKAKQVGDDFGIDDDEIDDSEDDDDDEDIDANENLKNFEKDPTMREEDILEGSIMNRLASGDSFSELKGIESSYHSKIQKSRITSIDISTKIHEKKTKYLKLQNTKYTPNAPINQNNNTLGSKQLGKIISLQIHFPNDHLSSIEILASSEWTLSDVFSKVKLHLANSLINQIERDYMFLYWEHGSLDAGKIEKSLLVIDPSEFQAQYDDIDNDEQPLMISTPTDAAYNHNIIANTSSNTQMIGSVSPSKDQPRAHVVSIKKSKTKKSEIPISMQYNMLVDCAVIPLLYGTKVSELKSHRLRICHQTEWEIYMQSSSIRTQEIEKDGIFNSLFSRAKFTYLALFMKFSGDIPFRSKTILGYNSNLCIRIPDITDWSDSFDVLKGDSNEACITLPTLQHNDTGYKYSYSNYLHYEFGTYIEKGSGVLQHMTSVTIVPKHIIISKLSMSIEISQINPSCETVECVELLPGSITSYHYSSKSKLRFLQIRRKIDQNIIPTFQEVPSSSSSIVESGEIWQGEIDISTIGTVYTKLRNPILILKIQVESVGASLVATFSEQTALWPPYRIDNLTNTKIRFKQVNANINLLGKEISPQDIKTIPWDFIDPRNNSSYSWDLPITAKKLIQIEIQQISTWIPYCEVELDLEPEDFHPNPLVIKKPAPSSQGNSYAEGYLYYQEQDNNWNKVYCILRPGVLYIYPDESRDYLKDLIQLSIPSDIPQFANVVKLMNKKTKEKQKGFFASNSSSALSTTMNSSSATTNSNNNATNLTSSNVKEHSKSLIYDINQVRATILKVADKLDLFQDVDPNKFKNVSYDSDSDDNNNNVDIEKKSLSIENKSVESAEDVAVINKQSSTLALLFNNTNESNDINKKLIFNSNEINADNEDKTKFKRKRNTLRTLLEAGVTSEQLLDEVSNVPVKVTDVIIALLTLRQIELQQAISIEVAQDMCDWMLRQGILVPNSNETPETSLKSEINDDNNGMKIQGIVEDIPIPNYLNEISTENQSDDSNNVMNMNETMKSNLTNAKNDIVRKNSLLIETITSSLDPTTKHKNLWKLYENMDVYFQPPVLNPELLTYVQEQEAIQLENQLENNQPLQSQHHRNNSINHVNHGHESGFTILINDKKYNFQCSSSMEFLGWIQACRLCIELTWIDYFLGRKGLKGQVKESLDDYQHSVSLRLRADGSTRVLEVTQSDLISKDLIKNQSKSEQSQSKSIAAVKVLNRLHQTISTSNDSFTDEEFILDREKELICAVFNVQSIALSVMDSEPSELLYLSFHDIEMQVDRSIDLVKFSVTVNEIQMSNQLLNPGFPVALYARKMKQGGKRLLLPGLKQERSDYPSLHFFIQQRYHQNIDAVDESVGVNLDENNISDDITTMQDQSALHYFEIFTLWIAPLQLNLDEEILVKFLRFTQGLREVSINYNAIFESDSFRNRNKITIEAQNIAYLATKYWETQQRDRHAVFTNFNNFLTSSKLPYINYNSMERSSTGVYFSVLQLHPLDIILAFKPSPDIQVNVSELALISVVSQLDSARLRLNAIIAEHLFGSPTFLAEFFMKRYRANFWQQFYKFIGGSDGSSVVEESSELVANLGSGVYGVYYEPIDGLIDENQKFLTGLSKGGKSLAARSIGGTSALASSIAGGLGKGVSILTLDSHFQRSRNYRRYNKATTVSEGLYVGTQELGKNIVEGVTGIVVSPYRGFETGGVSGFGMGIAKGLLGVALKPAVGVFDLASRATEGLRNSTLHVDLGLDHGVYRKRIPRAFGRNKQIMVYDERAAAAQYISDSLTQFKCDPRLHIIHHLHIIRKISDLRNKSMMKNINEDDSLKMSDDSSSRKSFIGSNKSYDMNNNIDIDAADDGDDDDDREGIFHKDIELIDSLPLDQDIYPIQEAWGYALNNSYLVVLTSTHLALIEILPNITTTSSTTTTNEKEKSLKRPPSLTSYKRKTNQTRKFIWCCPITYIDQLSSDPKGDLVITLNNSVLISGSWDINAPVILDRYAQNYMIFQSLLEQTIGCKLARLQPLQPSFGLIQHNILKRYSSGLKSYLLSPTSHTYRIFGHVLYEYTFIKKATSTTKGSTVSTATSLEIDNNINEDTSSRTDTIQEQSNNNAITARRNSISITATTSIAIPHEEYIDHKISKIFDTQSNNLNNNNNNNNNNSKLNNLDTIAEDIDYSMLTSSKTIRHHENSIKVNNLIENVPTITSATNYNVNSNTEAISNDMFLSFVYPLYDLIITDPVIEENGKFYSITIHRKDHQKMRVLKSEEYNEQMSEYLKNNLSLIFHKFEDAILWKQQIEKRIITVLPEDIINISGLTVEEKRKSSRTLLNRYNNINIIQPISNSILGNLILPTSSLNPELTETFKIEIAKALTDLKL